MAEAALENPVINSPYEPPSRHFAIGPNGPTGELVVGRRPSESFIPIPPSRKKKAEQAAFDFDLTHERIEKNSLINDVRQRVELWRSRDYPGVTPISRKLLQHWAAAPPSREDRMLFCQREAAETAIYLAEAAGRRGEPDFRTRLDAANVEHSDGLPRVALKMATGSGKTVVMAMLIAWQTINKVTSPRDARFAKRFLVVTPGITIRDRLRVLDPTDEGNYYRERDLVPPDLWPALLEARVAITNYHAFNLKDVKEIKGVAATTRKILNAGKEADAFKETLEDMVSRVLRDFIGAGKGEIVVLNDEAHHCYQDKPLGKEKAEKEDAERNADARVWFRGVKAIARTVGLKGIFDLSATPFYLKGSGHQEGFIFPWVVSDFSLMDAIESGIVKVPRVPVDDDAAGELVSYLNLWDTIPRGALPKTKRALEPDAAAAWVPPEVVEGALESLYQSYQRRFERWEATLAPLGEPPPVMIVVCPNTVVSKLVYDWIAGAEVERDDGSKVLRGGRLPLLSNVGDDGWMARPPTILVDSAALESGEALATDFKAAARVEIDRFKAEYRRRNPGADVDRLTDEDLLREVMNTVGKKGKLGESVRCVVSVAMLTEGWDANTVTHILGIRAFRSQLLCEQVVGRGLRRRSYEPNADGLFEPEYAEVYGVPFAFIPSERPVGDPKLPTPSIAVRALEERDELEITFPKLDGYRLEMPDSIVFADFSEAAPFRVSRNEVAVWVQTGGIAGAEEEIDLERYRNARVKEVAFRIASVLVHKFASDDDVRHTEATAGVDSDVEVDGTRTLRPDRAPQRPWMFANLVRLAERWLRDHVTCDDDAFIGLLMPAQACHRAAEALFNLVAQQQHNQVELLRPMLRRFDPEGTTATVDFVTRKKAVPAHRSHVSHVVLDGKDGNTWEEGVAAILEAHRAVRAYVKNDHLGFEVPYVHQGRSHAYIPDFLVALHPDDDGVRRTLIIEVSGSQKSPGPTKAKADTARDQWCTAVNNHGGWGRWGYLEIGTMADAGPQINAAIDSLYADAPIIGVPA